MQFLFCFLFSHSTNGSALNKNKTVFIECDNFNIKRRHSGLGHVKKYTLANTSKLPH